MTRRTCRALLLAVAALMLAPGLAHACNEPTLVVLPNVAGPGDTMQYTISNLTPGAKYELGIKGHVVAIGEASSYTVTGTFEMPDLGDRSTGFEVGGPVEHWDIEDSPSGNHTWPVQDTDGFYRAAAAAPDGPAESQPAPGTPPATAPDDRAPGATSPTGEPNANGHGHRVTRRATRPTRAPSEIVEPVESEVPVAAPAPATGEPHAVSISRGELHAVPVTISQHRPTWSRPARAPVPGRTLPQPLSEAPAAPAAGALARDGPALALMLVAALSAAGVCTGWLILLLRRGGEPVAPSVAEPPPRIPPDTVLEAELQEIIAVERLKRFEEEHGRNMAERGEPVRAGPG